MRSPLRSTLGQMIALQYVTLALGVAWWCGATAECLSRPFSVLGGSICIGSALAYHWLEPAGVAFVLFLVSAARLWMTTTDEPRAFALTAGMALYVAGVVYWEPFADTSDDPLTALVAVFLPFLCFRMLVARRQWLAIGALVLFLATGIASMLCNAGYHGGGVGFLVLWVT